ncbi:MAG: amidohydrolase family protein [Candidatus Dormibacteria bacterium]
MARLTDVHCHLLPPELRPRDAPSWRDPWFAACMAGERTRFAAGDDVLAALELAGLERAVVFGWPFADPGLLAQVNDYVAAEAARAPDRLLGLAVVNPARPGWEAELERSRSLGLVGVGELNSDAQGFELAFAGGLARLLNLAAEISWPVLLHASEPVGHRYPGKGSARPERLWELLAPALEQLPQLRLCLAHLGGGLPLFAHMPEVRTLCQRLWFDTAALPFLYHQQVLPALEELLGPGRLCLGSDFPLLPPARYRHLWGGDAPGAGAIVGEGPASWLGAAAAS